MCVHVCLLFCVIKITHTFFCFLQILVFTLVRDRKEKYLIMMEQNGEQMTVNVHACCTL